MLTLLVSLRETWNWFDPAEIPTERIGKRAPFTGCQGPRFIEWCAAYAADGDLYHPADGAKALWKPSIHMPRWASRILLEIVSVRVERLQGISDEDALAEGIYPTRTGSYPGAAKAEFMKVWESINGAAAGMPTLGCG